MISSFAPAESPFYGSRQGNKEIEFGSARSSFAGGSASSRQRSGSQLVHQLDVSLMAAAEQVLAHRPIDELHPQAHSFDSRSRSISKHHVVPIPQEISEKQLRQELYECQRHLLWAQEGAAVAERRTQEAEDSHQEELAALCNQLDVLDRHLLAEHEQQSEESSIARSLLVMAHEQLNQMNEELIAAQEEAISIEAVSAHGPPQLDVMTIRLQRSLREEQAFELEFETLSRKAGQLRNELLNHSVESDRLDERHRNIEEALERANSQIDSYESWSEGIHDELREVASELHEDQVASEMERQVLRDRIAELEKDHLAVPAPGYSIDGSCSTHADGSRSPHALEATFAPMASLAESPLQDAPALAPFSPDPAEDTGGEVPLSETHRSFSQSHFSDTAYARHPLPTTLQLQPSMPSLPFAPSVPSLAPHSIAPALTPVNPPVFQSPPREGPGMPSSQNVLWCRKAPSSTGLVGSPSAPVLV